MTFREAIDDFIRDWRAEGRINSDTTEHSYRACLMRHADDVDNRHPAYTNRDDVKRTLARWDNPNTRYHNHAVLRSFYDWATEEGHRKDNPARQVRRAKRKKPFVYKFTLEETIAFLDAAQGTRETRLVTLGVGFGLRRAELRDAKGAHFRRPGFVMVIGKGNKGRWVPVSEEFEQVWAEIAENVADDEYVIPAQRFRDPGINRQRREYRKHPTSFQALFYAVKRIGRRAGIQAEIGPHTMRHAFADHVGRQAGVRVAQFAMGHEDIATTEGYMSQPILDEMYAAMRHIRIRPKSEPVFYPSEVRPAKPVEAPTGIEPVSPAPRLAERFGRTLVAIRDQLGGYSWQPG